MPDAMNSTPIYQHYSDIPSVAVSYLIVMQQPDPEQIQHIFAQLNPEIPYQLLHVKGNQDAALAALLNELSEAVSHAKAGLHSVVIGDESFIWMVQQCLNRLSLMADEMSLILAGTTQTLKNVYCVHCGHVQKTAELDFCECEHCQVGLMIRSHFSQRLGAYMGVCANPHQTVGAAS